MFEPLQVNPEKNSSHSSNQIHFRTAKNLSKRSSNALLEPGTIEPSIRNANNIEDNYSLRQSTHQSQPHSFNQMQQFRNFHQMNLYMNQKSKKKIPKSSTEVFLEARKILKKNPDIRTPTENQILYQLTEHNQFLAHLVQKVSIQCFKGLMKTASIQEVRERQLLCQQGSPITHIVVLLDGKLGICKQQDDFFQQMNGKRSPVLKSNTFIQTQFPSSKNSTKQKQTKTIQATLPLQNIYDELTALSCIQIQTIRKKNALLKRKSSIPVSVGMFLPMPFSKQQFEFYEIESYVNPGDEYGAKLRCKSRFHTNTCFAVQRSILLILEFNMIVYWFQNSFRAKLGSTIEKLKKIPSFAVLDDGQIAECIFHMKKQKKKRNQYIYRQGSISEKLYILLNGEVKLSKQAKLFEQNPNDLYVDRRRLMQKNSQAKAKQSYQKKIDILPYADLTMMYNFRPIKKNIEIGIVTSSKQYFSLLGEEQLIEKRNRETDALVISFECQYYQIETRKLEELLGPKLTEQFYAQMEKSLKKVILYRQNEYAGKVNLQNRQNLDYFYYENDKTKESPRKYKLEKINSKFSDTNTNQALARTVPIDNQANNSAEDDVMKPYYTTFNFQKLIKTERLFHARKNSDNQYKGNNPALNRKDSDDSQDIKIKYDPVEQRMMDISHTWKPIKKKVIQEIKVMQKISSKRHSININEPLIEQKYFEDVEKKQKKINREHKIFKLSLGKRTKW